MRLERTMNVTDKLNQLAEMQAATDAIRLHFEELRDSLIPQEIKDKLAEVAAEEQTALSAANEGIAKLTNEIKAEVLQVGATVKSERLQAVYSNGRVSWDTKALDGYAAGHPELLQFRKEGEPSISIRAVK